VAERAVGVRDEGLCLVTYRASWLRKSVVDGVAVLVLGRTTLPEELGFLRSFLAARAPQSASAISALPDLPRGRFVLLELDEESGGRTPLTFAPAPRETPHVRHLKKYADARVSPERGFFFRRPDGRVVAAAESLGQFRRAVAEVEDQVLAHHAAHGDFSRWLLEVFADQMAGGQLRKVEARWSRGELPDLRNAIEQVIADRYEADR